MSKRKVAKLDAVVLIKRDDRTERAVAAVLKRKTCAICHEICTDVKIMDEKTGQIFATELSNFLNSEEGKSSRYSCKTCFDSLEKVVSLKSTISILEMEIEKILDTLKNVIVNRKLQRKSEIIKTRIITPRSRSEVITQAAVKDEESDEEEANSPELTKWLQVNCLESSSPAENDDMISDQDDDIFTIKEEEPFVEVADSAREVATGQIRLSRFEGKPRAESTVQIIIADTEIENIIEVPAEKISRKSPSISGHVDTSPGNECDEQLDNHPPTKRKSRVLADQLIRKTFHQNEQSDDDEKDESNSSGSEESQDYDMISDVNDENDADSDDDEDSRSEISDQKGKSSGESRKPFERNFQCQFCPKKYCYKRDLRKHIKWLHFDMKSLDEKERPGDDDASKQRFQCQFCTRKYYQKNGLRRHLRELHSDVWNPTTHCDECSETFQDIAALREHRETHRNKDEEKDRSTICDVCGKQLKTYLGLVSHRGQAHPDPDTKKKTRRSPPTDTFPCPICKSGYTSSSQAQLDRHVKHVHENPGQFQCPNCPRKFNFSSYLRGHRRYCKGPSGTRRDLRRERPFQCDLCLNTFVAYNSLQTHKKQIHPTEQVMKCPHFPECKKKFTSQRGLQEHVDEFHAELSERDFCKICDIKFPTVKEKIKHVRVTHVLIRSANCTECDRVFTGENAAYLLKAHMVVHTREKSYLCSKCGQSFSQQTALKVHTRIVCNPNKEEAQKAREMRAQRQKEYRERQRKCSVKCKICKKLFISEKNLKVHVDTVHNKKKGVLESDSSESESE